MRAYGLICLICFLLRRICSIILKAPLIIQHRVSYWSVQGIPKMCLLVWFSAAFRFSLALCLEEALLLHCFFQILLLKYKLDVL